MYVVASMHLNWVLGFGVVRILGFGPIFKFSKFLYEVVVLEQHVRSTRTAIVFACAHLITRARQMH